MSDKRQFLSQGPATQILGSGNMPGGVWLTTDFVEQIQRAHLKGRPVAEHIAKLTHTTIAGLVEYCCLKKTMGDLPDLPFPVQSSALGRNLCQVPSEIGLRQSGRIVAPTTSHKARDIEFVVIRDSTELLSDPIQMMFMRVTQSMKQAGFRVKTANEFQAALHEMMSNAVEHATSPVPALAGYHIHSKAASFVVADLGRGVFDSLRENPQYSDISDHCLAISKALHDGVTCRVNSVRGNGFRPLFKSIVENWGVLRFRSRKGCLTMSGTALDADQGISYFPPELPGFQVSVTCYATGTQPNSPAM